MAPTKKLLHLSAALLLLLILSMSGCGNGAAAPGEEHTSASSDIDTDELQSFKENTFECGGVTISLRDFSFEEERDGKCTLTLTLDIKGGLDVILTGPFEVYAAPGFPEQLHCEQSVDSEGYYILTAECFSFPETLYIVTPTVNLRSESEISVSDLSNCQVSYVYGAGNGMKYCVLSFEADTFPVFPTAAKLVSSDEEYTMTSANIGYSPDGLEIVNGELQFTVPEAWTETKDTAFVITESLAIVKPVLWQVSLFESTQEDTTENDPKPADEGMFEPEVNPTELQKGKTFSEYAHFFVEKQNGLYTVYVLDDLSIEETTGEQYNISYTVGTGIGMMQGYSCEYNPSCPYFPQLSDNPDFENPIELDCIRRVGSIHYTSDTIKMEAEDIQIGDKEQKDIFTGTAMQSMVYVSSFSGTVQTNTDTLYVSTPGLVIYSSGDRREMEEPFEVNNEIFAEDGRIGLTFHHDKPALGDPMIGRPRKVALVIDGVEYLSDEGEGHSSGEQYTYTYGILLPEGVSMDSGYSVVGYHYRLPLPVHVFEIALDAYSTH